LGSSRTVAKIQQLSALLNFQKTKLKQFTIFLVEKDNQKINTTAISFAKF
jgi:hypothetical protein